VTTLKEIQAVFFDAGGTLLYPHPSVGEIYARTARKHGLVVESRRMEKAFRAAWAECHTQEPLGQSSQAYAMEWWRHVVFRTLDLLDCKMPDREAYFQELYDLFARPDVWRLFPETKDVLAELSRRGCKLGLLSNWDSRLRPLLGDLGIIGYFQTVTISAEVGTEKPDAAIFRRALKDAGVNANSSLHVGDSYRDDIVGARGVGMQAVLLARDPAEPSPDGRTIRSLRELLSRVV
jgi:putative hydrolase of the HAD superfamily